jgi:hypothetical protein
MQTDAQVKHFDPTGTEYQEAGEKLDKEEPHNFSFE